MYRDVRLSLLSFRTFLAAALLAAWAPGAFPQSAPAPAASAPAGPTDAQLQEEMKHLATTDPQEQRARWGDLATMAGQAWLHVAPGEVANVWRDARWVVPGAVLRYHRGFCLALKCQGTEYVVKYNPEAKQLEFFENGEMKYTGRIQGDGAVRLVGTGIVGVLTAETLQFDAATQTLFSDKHQLKAATGAQLAEATRGLAGNPKDTGQPLAPSSEEKLRAELAEMKAQLESMRQQMQAPPPKPLTAAERKEAERRAAQEARERAAEERRQQAEQRRLEAEQRRLEAEERKRAEALARQEAARKAKEEAEARRAEAQRLAAEKRAREEEARRAAAEAKARAAEEAKAKAAAAAAARAAQKAAASAPARSNACGGIDGVYGTNTGYRIEVKFEGDTLTVREPNRTSVYRHEGRCQYAFTHPTGVTYRLGVRERALSAYKEDPGAATALALITAHAAPQAGGKCKAQEIPVENPGALHPGMTRLFGLHTVEGVKVPGTYNAPEPNGRPLTELGAGGEGGRFEVYGAPQPQYVYGIRRWYIQANCDGTPVRESFPAADRYFLIFELDREYSGLKWHRMQYIVRKGQDRVSIDDRAKGKQQ